MNLPSSALPDAVQRLLGLTGGAGTVREAFLGAIIAVIAIWVLLKGMLWLRKHKP